MKALSSLIIVLTVSVTAYSQHYTLPSVLYDSLTFEAYRGRQCGELVKFQANEIQKGINVEVKLTGENQAQSKVITSLNQEKAFLKAELKDNNELLEVQTDMTNHEKKQKQKWKFGTFVAVAFMGLMIIFGK